MRGGLPRGGPEAGGGAVDAVLAQLGGLAWVAARTQAPEGGSMPHVEVSTSAEGFIVGLTVGFPSPTFLL